VQGRGAREKKTVKGWPGRVVHARSTNRRRGFGFNNSGGVQNSRGGCGRHALCMKFRNSQEGLKASTLSLASVAHESFKQLLFHTHGAGPFTAIFPMKSSAPRRKDRSLVQVACPGKGRILPLHERDCGLDLLERKPRGLAMPTRKVFPRRLLTLCYACPRRNLRLFPSLPFSSWGLESGLTLRFQP